MVVLRPQAVQREADASSGMALVAVSIVAFGRAETWRPRERQHIKVEDAWSAAAARRDLPAFDRESTLTRLRRNRSQTREEEKSVAERSSARPQGCASLQAGEKASSRSRPTTHHTTLSLNPMPPPASVIRYETERVLLSLM